jgi:hypothetical protein
MTDDAPGLAPRRRGAKGSERTRTMRPFRSFFGRLALPLGVLVASGAAFVPLGCGSSQNGSGSAVVGATDVDMPDGIALQIRTCAANHRLYEKSGKLAAVFDVTLASDGEVTSVAVRDSTLADESLEACMARALQSLSESDLRARRSADPPLGSVTPESRGFFWARRRPSAALRRRLACWRSRSSSARRTWPCKSTCMRPASRARPSPPPGQL